jgi:uncharacterized protein YutE (UPF0331/DUF86 family)
MTDVILNKLESIERCVRQIKTYRDLPSATTLEADQLRLDAITLNLQRACTQTIDLANHIVRMRQLGVPKTSRDSFQLLANAGVIPEDLGLRMQRMVSFRNVLVHEYQRLDPEILMAVINNGLEDILAFAQRTAASDEA